MLIAATLVAAASCRRSVITTLDPMYAEDHLNYLCMNYTRPTPLPCRKVAESWKPRWGGGSSGEPSRFMIYAWWPPVPADFEAYANAGFNLALTGNSLYAYCHHKGPDSTVTHDELFEVNVATSDTLAKLGVLTIFDTDNMCNAQLLRGTSQAYGNATGGIVEGRTNITARAPGPDANQPWPGCKASRPISKGQTVPELEYITTELARRGKREQFGGIQLHDDTLTQTGQTISNVAWLKEHANDFVGMVNQVGGATGPQTLHRTGLFISAPEQYPMQCPHGNCSDPSVNATAFAMAQMNANANNAWVDARFGLQSWPLFQVMASLIASLMTSLKASLMTFLIASLMAPLMAPLLAALSGGGGQRAARRTGEPGQCHQQRAFRLACAVDGVQRRCVRRHRAQLLLLGRRRVVD